MENPFQKIIEAQLSGMQQKMQVAMAELAVTVVEASAGGGVVSAKATGNGELLEITIDQAVIVPEEAELLQDLVTAAVREVLAKAMAMKKEKIMGATPLAQLGIDIPDVF